MMLRFMILLLLATPALAQPLRFEWKAGDVHSFKVQHNTTITETLPGKPVQTTSTKLTLTKTWTVTSATGGTANIALAITSMKQVIARTGEETITLDSATPEGAQAMAAYLNKPIVTCTIDSRGRVTDVKGTAGDAASRLQAELPFRVEFADAAAVDWERVFTITLDPPVGTGEKHEATQSYRLNKSDGKTIIAVKTALKTPPKELADLQPLLPWLWEGDVQFDETAQRYLGAKLSISREYPNHQGTGSKFSFSSEYTESRDR